MSPEFQENIEEYFVANIKVGITSEIKWTFSPAPWLVFSVPWLSGERPCKCQMLIKNDQPGKVENTRPCYHPGSNKDCP